MIHYFSRLHIARYSPSLIRDASSSDSMISRRRNFACTCVLLGSGMLGEKVIGGRYAEGRITCCIVRIYCVSGS